MVDLSKAKAGDKVKFRCGGEAELTEIRLYDAHINGANWPIRDQGFWLQTREEHPLDIISIELAQIDWSAVKTGMAFLINGSEGNPWFYVGLDPFSIKKKSDVRIFSRPENPYSAREFAAWGINVGHKIVRAPEHDIEVSHE